MYVISPKIKINILQDAGIQKLFFPVSSTLRGSTTKFIYLGDVCTSIIKSIALFFASLLVPVSHNTQQKLLLLLLQLVVTTMTAAAIHAKAPTDSQIHHPGQFVVAATIVEWS